MPCANSGLGTSFSSNRRPPTHRTAKACGAPLARIPSCKALKICSSFAPSRGAICCCNSRNKPTGTAIFGRVIAERHAIGMTTNWRNLPMPAHKKPCWSSPASKASAHSSNNSAPNCATPRSNSVWSPFTRALRNLPKRQALATCMCAYRAN